MLKKKMSNKISKRRQANIKYIFLSVGVQNKNLSFHKSSAKPQSQIQVFPLETRKKRVSTKNIGNAKLA